MRTDGRLFAWQPEAVWFSRDDGGEYELVLGWSADRKFAADAWERDFLFPPRSRMVQVAKGERGGWDVSMAVSVFKAKDFTGKRAWEAKNVASMNGITTRIHWTNEPYIWHTNDGEEVFAVLDGEVEMRFRENGEEKMVLLGTGDVFFAGIGCEHVANPVGEARILVVEKEGSI